MNRGETLRSLCCLARQALTSSRFQLSHVTLHDFMNQLNHCSHRNALCRAYIEHSTPVQLSNLKACIDPYSEWKEVSRTADMLRTMQSYAVIDDDIMIETFDE